MVPGVRFHSLATPVDLTDALWTKSETPAACVTQAASLRSAPVTLTRFRFVPKRSAAFCSLRLVEGTYSMNRSNTATPILAQLATCLSLIVWATETTSRDPSGHNLIDDLAVDISEAEVTACVTVGELFVIEAQQVKNRGV